MFKYSVVPRNQQKRNVVNSNRRWNFSESHGCATQRKTVKGSVIKVSIFILKPEQSSPKPETQSSPVKAREFFSAQDEALEHIFMSLHERSNVNLEWNVKRRSVGFEP